MMLGVFLQCLYDFCIIMISFKCIKNAASVFDELKGRKSMSVSKNNSSYMGNSSLNETRLDDMIVDLLNFVNIAKNLETNSMDVFRRFFEKLYIMHKRTLYFWMKKNKDIYSTEQVEWARLYFKNRGFEVKW